MDAPQWSDLVARGRELVRAERGETRFELGDLALVAEPMGERGPNTGSLERLREYAEEIGTNFGTLRNLRQVANAWPHEHRSSSATWNAHRQLQAEPDRVDLIRKPPKGGWTTAALSALVAERHPKAAPRRSDKWYRAQVDALRYLRDFDAEHRLRLMGGAEARRMHATLTELRDALEPVIDALAERGQRPTRL